MFLFNQVYNKTVENGKSEIGVLTLVLFAIELNKTISYFFPESLLKDQIADVKTPFEHEILDYAKSIEAYGDPSLTLDILGFYKNILILQRNMPALAIIQIWTRTNRLKQKTRFVRKDEHEM